MQAYNQGMDHNETLSIMVSAGEASGDTHAAHALEALHEQGVSFQAFGMGADALRQQGVELLVDCREIAVIGLVDVLINYPRFMHRINHLRQALLARQPDLLLIVDYPDFNLKLAETAKKAGIPVLFYISPKVWAWRSGRVKRIASLVSHMAVLFPFEVDIYQKAGVPVSYVGNPVVKDAVSTLSRNEACEKFNLDPKKQVVALLPGSRHGEIKRNLPVMLATLTDIQKNNQNLQFLMPLAPTLTLEDIEASIGHELPRSLTTSSMNSCDAMRAADAAIVASGTATLETALIGTPLIVMYVINALNYAIMKRLIRIPDVSLVNIVAQRRIVPEYIQHDAVPADMAADIIELLEPAGHRRQTMLQELQQVKEAMGDDGASDRVATLIRKMTTA